MEEVVNVWIFETLEVKVNHVAFTLTWEPTEDFWQGSHMPWLGFVCLFVCFGLDFLSIALDIIWKIELTEVEARKHVRRPQQPRG